MLGEMRCVAPGCAGEDTEPAPDTAAEGRRSAMVGSLHTMNGMRKPL